MPKQTVLVNAFQDSLFDPSELPGGYHPTVPRRFKKTSGIRVYKHVVEAGRHSKSSYTETIVQSPRDNSITDALNIFRKGKRVASIMGATSSSRPPRVRVRERGPYGEGPRRGRLRRDE
jgi:hypothetical protein